MNIVIISGNLGSDPDLRMTHSGNAVLNFRVASNERVKKNDQWEDHTEWHTIVVFGKRAEALGKFLVKGVFVVVEGKLRTDSFEKDGQTHYRTKIFADDVEVKGGAAPDRAPRPAKQGPPAGWSPEQKRPPQQQRPAAREPDPYGLSGASPQADDDPFQGY